MADGPLPASRIFDLLAACRDAVVTYYALGGIDLPERRVVTPGLPAFDCEGLYVQGERHYAHQGNIGLETLDPLDEDGDVFLRALVVSVWLARCTHTQDDDGTIPTADEEESDARLVYADAAYLLNAIVGAVNDGLLPGCNGLVFESWQGIGPEGGMGGGALRVRLNMDAAPAGS